MLWIQMSDGERIYDINTMKAAVARNKEAFLVANGISIGKLRSWNKGAFYEVIGLGTVIERKKLCWLLDYKLNTIQDAFEAMDYVCDVTVLPDSDNSRMMREYEHMRASNRACRVSMKRFGVKNQTGVYVIYAKTMSGAEVSLETKPVRDRNGNFEIGLNRLDKYIFL